MRKLTLDVRGTIASTRVNRARLTISKSMLNVSKTLVYQEE